ncbi:MAG: twin-arginine translocase subunit TatB [Candidatus Competibacteraceae bacterium]|nr:twin-arginine translocase subunit TatB [Candidatus Competibacteraceae bacterium]MCB1820806.1 twin-arginine translocase subunit TatB [Candidatus Competibacteraceae bacterium]
MFEIGFWELALIGVVAMIVVGPERLPGLARTAGLWLGKARRMVAEVKAEVDRELHLEEIKQSLREQGHLAEINDIKKDLTNRVKEIQDDLQAEFDDPGPPPGWRPGAVSAPPPPDWQPSALNSPVKEATSTPVSLQKPAPSESPTSPAAN